MLEALLVCVILSVVVILCPIVLGWFVYNTVKQAKELWYRGVK